MSDNNHQTAADEWVSFNGGQLEGKRPKAMCPACRAAALKAVAGGADDPKKPLCFACYRADLDRLRALKAAGQLDTASEARFQFQLPFEPVDHLRLATLRSDREFARGASSRTTAGPYADRRRQAQIAARHVLRQIADGFAARRAPERAADVFEAVELRLPEAWIPFVMSRSGVR